VNVIGRHPEVARALQARLDEALSRGPTAGSVGVTETPAAIPGMKW